MDVACAEVEFYSAVAQVVPVLALAAMVEFAAIGRRLPGSAPLWPWLYLINVFSIFGFGVAAEVLALDALGGGARTELRQETVEIFLISMVTPLLLTALAPPLDALPQRSHLVRGVVLGLVVVAALGGTLAVALT